MAMVALKVRAIGMDGNGRRNGNEWRNGNGTVMGPWQLTVMDGATAMAMDSTMARGDNGN